MHGCWWACRGAGAIAWVLGTCREFWRDCRGARAAQSWAWGPGEGELDANRMGWGLGVGMGGLELAVG